MYIKKRNPYEPQQQMTTNDIYRFRKKNRGIKFYNSFKTHFEVILMEDTG